MKHILVFLTAVSLFAQSAPPGVPSGLIYQVAIANGFQPISPLSGQAIINERAAVNWKTIAGQVLADGSIGLLTGGLAGVIHLSTPVMIGLASGHAFYDHSVAPILAAAAPNPGDIPPVLQVTGSLAPTSSTCTENSMYVTPSKNLRSVGPIVAYGLSLSFSVQSPQVLKNAAGSIIKRFQVVEVLACPVQTASAVRADMEPMRPPLPPVNAPATPGSAPAHVGGGGGTTDGFILINPSFTTQNDSAPVRDWQSLPLRVASIDYPLPVVTYESTDTTISDFPTVTACTGCIEITNRVLESRSLESQGRYLNQVAEYRGAIIKLTRAVQADPSLATAWNALGFARLMLGENAAAVDALDHAIALRVNYSNAKQIRSIALSRLKTLTMARN